MVKEEFDIGKEIKIIPLWAWIAAPLELIGMELLWNVVVPAHKNPPPLAFRMFMGTFLGVILGVLILLVGYVNRDSRRRGMNVALWTLLVAFLANPMVIIYFLVRHPLYPTCPQCGASIQPGFNFCPKCHFNLTPMCPNCSRPVRPGDVYCAYCGAPLGVQPEAKVLRP
jgi:hypothetical protein